MAHCDKDCISLFLTDRCNLRCRYCYCPRDARKGGVISVPFAKRGIADFFESRGTIHLRLFGEGEPTLAYPVMVECTEFARQLDPEARVELQTNGYFGKGAREWIAKHVNIVWISYDGLPDVHDFYRPTSTSCGSSSVVERNIAELVKKGHRIGVRATVGRRNIDRQREMIDHLFNLGVRCVYSDLMFAPIGERAIEEGISPAKYARAFVEAHQYAKSRGIFYGSFFTINFDRRTSIACRCCLPSPHLTVDGRVVACDMACSGANMEPLVYGRYDPLADVIHYDQKAIKLIQARKVEALSDCGNCEVKYHCAGGCIGEALNERGSMFAVKNENCDAVRYLAKELKAGSFSIPCHHP